MMMGMQVKLLVSIFNKLCMHPILLLCCIVIKYWAEYIIIADGIQWKLPPICCTYLLHRHSGSTSCSQWPPSTPASSWSCTTTTSYDPNYSHSSQGCPSHRNWPSKCSSMSCPICHSLPMRYQCRSWPVPPIVLCGCSATTICAGSRWGWRSWCTALRNRLNHHNSK